MVELEFQKPKLYFRDRDGEKYPVRRDDRIEPGKTYRTRDGGRVRIYSIENREVHGALFHDDAWQIDTWNLDGTYLDNGKEHSRDIVLSKPLTIAPSHKYKSRDGRPIKVFEVNRGSKDYPIIGAIKDTDSNSWVPRVWNDKGMTKVPYGPKNDIVAEWSET